MFLIPGIIGPEESENAYKDLSEFVTATHKFKSDHSERLDKLIEAEK